MLPIQPDRRWRQLPRQQPRWKYICCDCIDTAPGSCLPYCAAVPLIWSLSSGGWVDGTCPDPADCAAMWNGTFDLLHSSIAGLSGCSGSCSWYCGPDLGTSCLGTNTGLPGNPCVPRWSFHLSDIGGYLLIQAGGVATYRMLADDFDCFGTNVFTLFDPAPDSRCATKAGTVTITPA